MNSTGGSLNNFQIGVTGIVSGNSGIVCTPDPITRTGTISLNPVVTEAISTQETKTQHVTADTNSTRVDSVFQVNDFSVEPFFIVDPTASLVVQGSTVFVANLQPISQNSTIGSVAIPFENVYTQNVTTPGTNLNALATSVSNHTTLIAGLTNVTQNQSASPDVTQFAGQVTADQFVKDGGTANQYLMADGSTRENSNSNANSNIYLYNSSTVHAAPPALGEVRFNATTNAASSVLWLNHTTRDGIDVRAFLNLITSLSVIYIQQENDAANYVKYNVNSNPTIIDPVITLDVTFLEGAGTGVSSFGVGTPIFVSVFTNDREIDERLSLVEARSVNLNSFGTLTNFAGIINMGNNRIINLPSVPVGSGDAASVAYVQGQIGAFITQAEAAGEFLSLTDAQTALAQKLNVPENDVGQRLNSLYYDVTTGFTSFSLNMESWRYLSWGYVAPATVSVVDCVTTLMTHQGGSLANIGINASIAPKGYKIRVGSNVSSTTNGATSGWLGAPVQNFILPRAGWYIKIGFSLDSTSGSGSNRTMIGLFQSNARPVLDNTTTIASVVTGSMGIVQEKGETVFSFHTRGPSGSTKIPTTISCETPNNNWYTLEMINEPRFLKVTLILTSQTDSGTETATTSFICGGANTMSIATAWVHLQQGMASPGGITGSAFLTMGNITMKMAQ
jgi:hypothetical protein